MSKKSFTTFFVSLSLLLTSTRVLPQNTNELINPLNDFKKDSIEANNLMAQIDTFYKYENFTNASQIIDKTIPICEKLGFKAQLAKLYRTRGDIYRSTDNYIKALDALSISMDYYVNLDDKKGIAGVRNRIGAVYRLQGKYPEALEHYFEALKEYQSINFGPGISVTLNNIGIVYLYQKEYDKALEYYFKSLKLGEEINDEESIGISYINIGEAYQKKKDYNKAIDYYLKSLIISKKLKDLDAIGVNYNEIGSIYTDQNNLQQASVFLGQALKAFKELGSKSRQAECELFIGRNYAKSKDLQQAIIHFNIALDFAKRTGSKELYKNAVFNLSEVYESTKNSTLALKYYKEYISIRDSIFNEENTKRSIQAELLYQFENKQKILKLEQAKKDAIYIEKAKNQKVFRNFLIAILTLLIILITFVFSAFRSKHRANIILANQQNEILEKNEELLQQQEEILTQRDEIEHKNLILERSQQIIAAKNDRIISSIEYAQTIQQAILPHEDQLSKYFLDHFVVFLPKDIVSGDFFWFSADQDLVFAAVIDCTGHGVPGSFMSLIGNTLLNQIVNEWHTHDPALILEYLHQKIRTALQQDEVHSKSHASMDICFVKINTKTHKATFAGASRPLLVIQNGTLIKIPGDKKSVGGFQRETKRYFTNHEIQLSSNSYLYLTTDGFIDQMNPAKRKYGPNQLIKLLEENHTLPMAAQKDIILNKLETFKQGEEQIDDICILGIKI
jgi:serine phosphatase RsbU (regulator of sigma subunit)